MVYVPTLTLAMAPGLLDPLMAHFQKAFVDFFANLARHNDTAWFDGNRKTYETEVKRPFEVFAQEMIRRIAAVDPEVGITSKDAISRINRDTRFGADKRPYHTHLSAAISKFGKKNKEYPGILFQLSHDGVLVFGGCYAPEKETLAAVRTLIAKDGKAFRRAIEGKPFRKLFGELRGEEMKRIGPEWSKAHAHEPLIAKKQFYYQATLPVALVLDAKLPDVLMQHFAAAREVNTFLQRAFG